MPVNVQQLIAELRLDDSQYRTGLQNAARQAQGFGLQMSLATTLPLAGLAKLGVGFNELTTRAKIAFTSMLGDGRKAERMLEDLRRFAARTPFEFPELITAAQRLKAMGFEAENIIPSLTAIGDAVANLGGSAEMVNRVTLALGQMQAKQKVSGEEMRQLTEAGIPAWQMLADRMGKTTAELMKMSERGLIPAREGVAILLEEMEARAPQAMEKMSKTLTGQISNIKDSFGQLMGAVMGPFTERLTKGATEVANTLEKMRSAAERVPKPVFDVVAAAGAATAAIGPLTLAASGFMGVLTVLAGPAGWIVKAGLAITALGTIAILNSDKLLPLTRAVGERLVEASTRARNELELFTAGLVGKLKPAIDEGKEWFRQLAEAVETYAEKLEKVMSAQGRMAQKMQDKGFMPSMGPSMGPYGGGYMGINGPVALPKGLSALPPVSPRIVAKNIEAFERMEQTMEPPGPWFKADYSMPGGKKGKTFPANEADLYQKAKTALQGYIDELKKAIALKREADVEDIRYNIDQMKISNLRPGHVSELVLMKEKIRALTDQAEALNLAKDRQEDYRAAIARTIPPLKDMVVGLQKEWEVGKLGRTAQAQFDFRADQAKRAAEIAKLSPADRNKYYDSWKRVIELNRKIEEAEAAARYNQMVMEMAEKGWKSEEIKKKNAQVQDMINFLKEMLKLVDLQEKAAYWKRSRDSMTFNAWIEDMQAEQDMADFWEEYGKRVEQAKFQAGIAKFEQMKEQTQQIVEDLASSFQDIFAEAFLNLDKGFQGFFDSVLTGFQRLLSEIAAEFLASQVMRWMMGQLGGPVGFLSGLIGNASNAATAVSTGFTGQTGEILPGNAVGGLVRKGLAYIVGERGPELFVPNQSGSIQGNLAAAGGGGTTIVFNVYAKDYASFRPNQGQMIADAVRQADLARRRNGQADVR